VLGVDSSALLRAKALAAEGQLAMLQGDYLQARTLLQEGLALAEALHDRVLMGRILSRLGAVAALQDDVSDAQALLERGLALSREAGGDPRDVAFALLELGRTFVLLEDLERAEAAVTEGLDLARGTGSPQMIAFALPTLAQLKLRRRDYPAAAGLAAEALHLARTTESRFAIKYVVGIAALVSGHHGDVERAVRLLAAVERWSDWTGEFMSPTYHDPAADAAFHARARQQMGEEVYRAAVVEAKALSMDEVADLAQACLEPSTRGPAHIAARAEGPRPLLTDRERAVLRLIGEGLPNKQIATALSIAERTVKSHVASAMNKLGVDNRAHAAVAAIQRGLL